MSSGMEKKLDKIDEKLDVIDSRLTNIDKTLISQAGQLEHHIYRTDLAEQHLRVLEGRLHPLTDFHSKFNAIMKGAGILATACTFLLGLAKLIKELL